jgi:hypothetical protein
MACGSLFEFCQATRLVNRMNIEFQAALEKRKTAARAMQNAAAILTRTHAEFAAASADALRLIGAIAVQVGSSAQARATGEWTNSDPPGTQVEAAHRKHSAAATGAGAAGAIEHRLCTAFSAGFFRGSAAETFAHELSLQAAEFLSHAVRTAAAELRPESHPSGKFAAIVGAQNQRLIDISKGVL